MVININRTVTPRVEFSNMMESSIIYYLLNMTGRFDGVGNSMTFVVTDQFVHQHFHVTCVGSCGSVFAAHV